MREDREMKELDLWQRLDQIEAKLDLLLAKKKPVQKLANKKPTDEALCIAFNQWWSVYPKKVNKHQTFNKWKKIRPDVDVVVADTLNRIKNDQSWQDRQYIPYPSTYLNGRRWEDDITPLTVKAAAIPADNNDLEAWAVDKGLRNPRPGESFEQYRQAVNQLYRT